VAGGSLTVTPAPELSIASETSPILFRSILLAQLDPTIHAQETALRYAGATPSLHRRRGDAGALCPQERLTRAAFQPHPVSPPRGEHAEATCPATCAGMDGPPKDGNVCVGTHDSEGRCQEDVRSLHTLTRALLAMRTWLQTQACTVIATE
jgi:hypothetical protein